MPRVSKAAYTVAIIRQHEAHLHALHLNGGMNSDTDSCKRKTPAACTARGRQSHTLRALSLNTILHLQESPRDNNCVFYH